jgi:predicted O-methyltransferase YrrM
VLVRAMLARRVLEIGTSNGYSTLFLAVAPLTIALVSTVLEASHHTVGTTQRCNSRLR